MKTPIPPAVTRRHFLQTGGLAAATWLGASVPPVLAEPAATDDSVSPVLPTPQQVEWQDFELGLFIHYDMPVFQPEWKGLYPAPDPRLYNPRKLNTDQWLEAAQALGARYAVFVAKHGSGFMQWQSDLYPYGVRQSPWLNGKGDVVENFVASCHRHGIRPGIYANINWNAFLNVRRGRVNAGKGGDPDAQRRYARICEQQLTELWSRYGTLTEIWFDGGVLPPDQGGPDVVPLLRRWQPNAIVFQGPAANIRWIGNESGVADYPCWATAPSRDSAHMSQRSRLHGDPDGKYWLPGECDVPLRWHHWMWQPGQANTILSVEDLMKKYSQSVGRNCNLLLNSTPNPEGLIPEPDFRRYAEFSAEIHRRFGQPYASTSGAGNELVLRLPRAMKVDRLVLMEEIARGERVREYTVDYWTGQGWEKLCSGSSIGHKRIQSFAAVQTSKVRLKVTRSAGEPLVRRLAVYVA